MDINFYFFLFSKLNDIKLLVSFRIEIIKHFQINFRFR